MDYIELLKAVILGAVQGLTEFLPISSSGHLVIGSELLDFEQQGVVFDVFVHLGTLLAVIVVFRREILQMMQAPFKAFHGTADEESRVYLLWDIYVIIATIPAVIAGLFLKDHVEFLFDSLPLVYTMLLITAFLMMLTPKLKERNVELNGYRSFLIGCAQACAIMPGLSRSGSTIFTGMLLGLNREKVARFSFIMSIPAILGAVVLQTSDLADLPFSAESVVNIAAGTVAAAFSGYLAIVLLLDIVRKNRLQYFGYYCICVALAGFTILFIS